MNNLKNSRLFFHPKVQQIPFSWWIIVIVLPFPWWNVSAERSCLLFSNQKKLLWQTWHSIQMFLLLFLLVSSVELRCVCGLTCRGLLAGDVGFDVWRQVRGFRVLAWGQVGRHGCPGCHWRRWIPSHWWSGIPGHPSASAWLRKDEHKCLEHQHIDSTTAGFHCGNHLTRACWVCVLPRSLQPVWRRYILPPLPLEGFLGHWMAPTSDRERRTVINPFTQGWKSGCLDI